MHEGEKLGEAEYFYIKMQKVIGEPLPFRYNLSAFLSAARSVLQYALKEAQAKPHGQGWFDEQVTEHPVVAFFKDKRDINIHTRPIDVRRNLEIRVPSGTLRLSEAVNIDVYEQGRLVSSHRHTEPLPSESPTSEEAAPTSRTTLQFTDWAGQEDVITLCGKYLNQLAGLVASGRALGFLT